MILHLVPDDKFIDFAYSEFEKAAPNQNKFLVISDKEDKKFKYIKSAKVEKISPTKVISQKFIESLKNYEFVVLHWFSAGDNAKIQLVLKASCETKFVWLGWGGDFYKYIAGNRNSLFLKKTSKLWRHKNKIRVIQFIPFKSFIKKIVRYENDHLKAIKKIKYFAPIIPTEYDLLKNALPQFKSKYVPFSYGNIDDLLRGLEQHQIQGQNILLGNSATYENNHLEAFDLIAKLDIEHRNIIVPLSYGDSEYRDIIIAYGKNKFGENFLPLVDFMVKEKYHKIIASCSIVIMNHLRQQAMGNINTMMYLGAKIFLNPKNPVFAFFRNEGAYVFSTDTILKDPHKAFEVLSEKEIAENRKILKKYWSVKAVEDKTRILIETIRNDKV